MKIKHNPNITLEFTKTTKTSKGYEHEISLRYEGPMFFDIADLPDDHMPDIIPHTIARLLCQNEE